MENGALETSQGVEAPAEAKVDEASSIENANPPSSPPPIPKEPSFSQWCGDAKRSASPSERSSESSAAEEQEEFGLPLLQADGSERTAAERAVYFRQRSSAVGFEAGPDGNGKHFATFDIESGDGLHPSESQLKLDLLEQAAQNSISPATVLKTLFYILVWYTFSTCLTLYNKALLGDKLGKFPAPMLMNTFHFTLQAILSKIIVCFRSRSSETTIMMTWKDYFFRVVPTALGTALDVNLSNASLVFITVTFATMCKSASPIFLLLFAFAFRLEVPSIKLLGIIMIISLGVLLTVTKETEFQFWGFVFVMLAAVMSGFRWSMTQILLQKETYGLKDPMTLMSYVTPVMAIATLILSLVLDPWRDFEKNSYFNNSWHIIQSCLLMLIGGALAFFMVLTEYVLVSATSAVTVTIAGVVKEAVTIVVAIFYFHDKFSLLKGIGLLTIMVGVGLFNWYKYEKLRKGRPAEVESVFSISNGATKYVILDDSDVQDDET